MTALDKPRLRCGIVLRATEDDCEVVGETAAVRFAAMFPTPRVRRVSPGHLVAIASSAAGPDAVVWRWYDAVVLGADTGSVRLWEPAHGEVLAARRNPRQQHIPGTRAYLSAGLPGAEWWVNGAVVASPDQADVELAEVDRFYTEHNLWPAVFATDE